MGQGRRSANFYVGTVGGGGGGGGSDVTIVAEIPAGTKNIGDVDVLTLPAIPAGANAIGTVALNAAIPAGTNNIGDVDVLTLPAIPAGANTIGNVGLVAGSAAFGKLSANSGVDIGDVDVTSVSPPTAIFSGKTTVVTATTRVALAASQALARGVTVKAFQANTGNIFVGTAAGVSATSGVELAPGESVFIECSNLNLVGLDATTSSSGCSVGYVAS